MKIKTILIPVALIILMMSLSRCYYDSEEFLYPQINSNCDTSKYSFDTLVSPILQAHCLNCHGTQTSVARGTFKLVTYDDVKAHVDRLVGSVAHEKNYVFMPQEAAKLDECDIAIIRKWVNEGALHN